MHGVVNALLTITSTTYFIAFGVLAFGVEMLPCTELGRSQSLLSHSLWPGYYPLCVLDADEQNPIQCCIPRYPLTILRCWIK